MKISKKFKLPFLILGLAPTLLNFVFAQTALEAIRGLDDPLHKDFLHFSPLNGLTWSLGGILENTAELASRDDQARTLTQYLFTRVDPFTYLPTSLASLPGSYLHPALIGKILGTLEKSRWELMETDDAIIRQGQQKQLATQLESMMKEDPHFLQKKSEFQKENDLITKRIQDAKERLNTLKDRIVAIGTITKRMYSKKDSPEQNIDRFLEYLKMPTTNLKPPLIKDDLIAELKAIKGEFNQLETTLARLEQDFSRTRFRNDFFDKALQSFTLLLTSQYNDDPRFSQILLSYLWKISHGQDDFNTYYHEFSQSLGEVRKNVFQAVFVPLKEIFEESDTIKEIDHKDPLVKRDRRIYSLLKRNLKNNPLQDQKTAYLKTGEFFADCGETTLKNLIKIAIERNGVYDTQILRDMGGVDERVIQFFEDFPTRASQMTQEARNAWGEITSHLEQPDDPIDYIKNTCEINAGQRNMLRVVKKLFNAKSWKELAQKIQTHSKRKFSISESSLRGDLGYLIISTESEGDFKFHFQSRHFYIEPVLDPLHEKVNNSEVDTLVQMESQFPSLALYPMNNHKIQQLIKIYHQKKAISDKEVGMNAVEFPFYLGTVQQNEKIEELVETLRSEKIDRKLWSHLLPGFFQRLTNNSSRIRFLQNTPKEDLEFLRDQLVNSVGKNCTPHELFSDPTTAHLVRRELLQYLAIVDVKGKCLGMIEHQFQNFPLIDKMSFVMDIMSHIQNPDYLSRFLKRIKGELDASAHPDQLISSQKTLQIIMNLHKKSEACLPKPLIIQTPQLTQEIQEFIGEYYQRFLAPQQVPSNTQEYWQKLMLAATATGHQALVEKLLEKHNEADHGQLASALLEASKNGMIDLLPSILKKVTGGDPNKEKEALNRTNESGQSALNLAAHNKHVEVVKFILSKEGIAVNQKDNHHTTPLREAVFGNSLPIVQMLRQHDDIAINDVDENDLTVLNLAIQQGKNEIVTDLLLHDDIDINRPDNEGVSPLINAIKAGNNDVAMMLLDRGDIEVNQPDKAQRSPLSWAVVTENIPLVKKLLSKGNVNLQAKNKAGETALDIAELYDYDEISELLKNPAQ